MIEYGIKEVLTAVAFLIVVLPIAVFICFKMGTYGYLVGRHSYYRRYGRG